MGINQMIAPVFDKQPSAKVSGIAPRRSEADALEAALGDMAAAFSSDFIGGLVGKRHNTFEHRSRVLRQMTAELASMRAQDAAQLL